MKARFVVSLALLASLALLPGETLSAQEARSRQEEFLAVSYDLPDNAEAVIFRFEPNTSAAAIAKIKFRMRKLGVSATTNGEAAPVTAPAN